MSLKAKLLTGTLVLTMGEMLGYGSSFARNMILARMLTKADFGIAAAFALVVSMFELTGKLAIGQLVVQDKDGDKVQFIATAHAIQFIVALFSAFLMLILSMPLASFLNLPGDRWAFQSLALIPLFKGLEHLDVRRFGRELRFIPASLLEVIPQVLITLAAYPLALWLKDYRTVLILLLTKGAITCVGSHYFAEHPYRWHFEIDYIQRIFRFGWPLLINSLLMMAIFQGDQFLVGRFFSMSDLAVYASASTLTLVPGLMFAGVMNTSMLPIMSQAQGNKIDFARRYSICIHGVCLFTIIVAPLIIIASDFIMLLAFGNKYAEGGYILAILCTSHSFRIIRNAPSIAALAKADSKNQMYSNLARSLSLIPAVFVCMNHNPIWQLALCGLLGELISLFLAIYLLNRRDSITLSTSFKPIGVVLVFMLVSELFYFCVRHLLPSYLTLFVALVVGVLGGFASYLLFLPVRSFIDLAFIDIKKRIAY